MSQLATMNLKEKENVSEKMEKFSLKVSKSDKKLIRAPTLTNTKLILKFSHQNINLTSNSLHSISRVEFSLCLCGAEKLIFLFRLFLSDDSQSPRKALTENETNVLPKQPKLKGMDDVSQLEPKKTEGEEESGGVGAIAHKSPAYPFDPSKEPLLRDNPRRFVIFPIEYQDIWQMYKKVIRNEFNVGFDVSIISVAKLGHQITLSSLASKHDQQSTVKIVLRHVLRRNFVRKDFFTFQLRPENISSPKNVLSSPDVNKSKHLFTDNEIKRGENDTDDNFAEFSLNDLTEFSISRLKLRSGPSKRLIYQKISATGIS